MAKKASEHFKSYVNIEGPTVSTMSRKIIETDGLYFKDIDGSGTLSPVNDWRLAPEEQAAAYVKLLTLEEKLAQLFISDWRMGNVERNVDALTAGFDTYPDATLDVIFGAYAPTGKLPMTLPRGDEVLHVDENGICVSPNDVPGYNKDLYMPDAMKDENGKAYAYRYTAGNYYELGFGLEY